MLAVIVLTRGREGAEKSVREGVPLLPCGGTTRNESPEDQESRCLAESNITERTPCCQALLEQFQAFLDRSSEM